jgi:hypothetical protein
MTTSDGTNKKKMEEENEPQKRVENEKELGLGLLHI